MNELKIGDKVETPFGIGILKDSSSVYGEVSFGMVGEEERTMWLYYNDEIKPYKSAHDKLLALGWGNNDCYYEMGNHCIVVNKEEKTFEITSEVGYSLEIDLEISRILTQYLEELNEV